ncbi:NADH-quinone oxidoreductase subunit C [Streptomyces sp. NPDC096030]|uniref:NADH-quinone oxidoreductase subunit C n=1 Tax=Streptomyces sp. NPDC096030 TaxID=3155423 RepID=UPI0033221964
MNAHAYDSLPEAVTEVFGEEATAQRAYDLLTVDVPVGSWIAALEIARDKLGCTYFDWLSAVDEPGTGFRVCAHVVALEGGAVRRLLVRTTVSHESPVLATAVPVYAGAEWHERETHEMFGVEFTDHPNLVPLLLPENFEGHPLRKDFVLAARVVKAWPGAKEPGESEHGGPKRRQMLPPGVPDPNDWGPMKGQLPPAPARPARGAAAAGDRPARRARTTAEGSATQPEAAEARPPRRTRSVSEGSASQAEAAEAPEAPVRPPRRTRSASDGSASQAAEGPATQPEAAEAPVRPPRRTRSASDGSASQAAPPPAPSRPRSSDAPWHHARPAFDPEATRTPKTEPAPEAGPEPKTGPAPEAGQGSEAAPAPDAVPASEARPAPEGAPAPEAAPAPEGGPASEGGADPEAGSGRTDQPTTPDGGESA